MDPLPGPSGEAAARPVSAETKEEIPLRLWKPVSDWTNINERILAGEADSRIRDLIDNRRLILLVDLDETMIQSKLDIFHNHRTDLFHVNLPEGPYHVKVRPHILKCLKHLTDHFIMHVCTLSTQAYAEKILQHVDPDSAIFEPPLMYNSGGISKKTTLINQYHTNMEHVIVVLDDRVDVWDQFKENVIKVNPFFYFRTPADVDEKTMTQNGRRILLRVQAEEGDPPKVPTGIVHFREVLNEKEEVDRFNSLYFYLLAIHDEFYRNYDKLGSISVLRAIRNVNRDRDTRKLQQQLAAMKI